MLVSVTYGTNSLATLIIKGNKHYSYSYAQYYCKWTLVLMLSVIVNG